MPVSLLACAARARISNGLPPSVSAVRIIVTVTPIRTLYRGGDPSWSITDPSVSANPTLSALFWITPDEGGTGDLQSEGMANSWLSRLH